MIELRKYECMHVYRARTRDLVSARIYDLSQSGGRGHVYEIKTLRSNLAPNEGGGGVYSRGAYN